jgi:UV DNA damage endonuclease
MCCLFEQIPIRFRTTTAQYLSKHDSDQGRGHLAALAEHNAAALRRSIVYCSGAGIGAFRVNSRILPLSTHPEFAYRLEDLPMGEDLRSRFEGCGRLARELNIRLSFHPDQFVVLNSLTDDVVERSIAELASQARVAAWLGADVINLHAGGVYGDRAAALQRLRDTIEALPTPIRQRLTLENDDRCYTPSDLLPVCRDMEIPFVYDVHHQRCHDDGRSVGATTDDALATWNREPLFHISSPRDGWGASNTRPHHGYIDVEDFPTEWLQHRLTVDVEAKAKEQAVARLHSQLQTSDRQARRPEKAGAP